MCQKISGIHFSSQESCIAGFYPCFQSGLRTCFAITYSFDSIGCSTFSVHTYILTPQDKMSRKAKFGTVVESCSKKLRCVVCLLTIRLLVAGLLRSGENISWNFLIPSTDGAGILPTLRRYFSPYYLQHHAKQK